MFSLYAAPINVPVGMSCSFSFCLTSGDIAHSGAAKRIAAKSLYGHRDFFGLGCVRGGWDEAAWAAKGLPLTGELTFTMDISSVGHAAC